jgi:FkbM family methyltransferase
MQLQRHLKKHERMQLNSKRLNHPVMVRPRTSDFRVFQQIFVEREYRCLDEIEGQIRLIIDLGANVGYSSAYFLSRFPNCRALSVEPESNNYETLKTNVAAYGSRCQPIKAAVWWREENLRLRDAPPGEEWGFSVEPSDRREIPVVTVPMLAKSERIGILKIDIEGAERELFSHETDWLDQTDNIVIELHGEECRDIFFGAMKPHHFHISECGELTLCRRSRAQIIAAQT